MIGFPTWTLWGMGLSALAALIAITLALIGQSPRLIRRLGLDVYRLDLRVRAFTGYAFACLLLTLGFFLAGVPLGPPEPAAVAAEATAVTPEGEETPDIAATMTRSAITTTVTVTALVPTASVTVRAPASGAFGGLPSRTPTGEAAESIVTPDIPTPTEEGEGAAEEAPATTATDTLIGTGTSGATTEAATAASTLLGTPSATPSATPTGTPTRVTTATPTATRTPTPTGTASPTPTRTPTATPSPTPTLTPTPIEGETAVIDSSGNRVWLYRSPGGQQLLLIADGATVIILPGHANQAGILWQEVMTVEGVSGWIRAEYLTTPE